MIPGRPCSHLPGGQPQCTSLDHDSGALPWKYGGQRGMTLSHMSSMVIPQHSPKMLPLFKEEGNDGMDNFEDQITYTQHKSDLLGSGEPPLGFPLSVIFSVVFCVSEC